MLDAKLYDFKVTEGSKEVGETVASINIRRVDKEEFSGQELEELKTYVNEKFQGAFTSGASATATGMRWANPPRVPSSSG